MVLVDAGITPERIKKLDQTLDLNSSRNNEMFKMSQFFFFFFK
jgi:hypothetical protein